MATAVLALQGAFAEHEKMLDALGEPWIELRSRDDMDRGFDRVILPGGESTVQGKLLREEGMMEPLRSLIAEGMPVLGTCAGAILLAKHIIDGSDDRSDVRAENHIATMGIDIERNAYGRQLASFHASAPFQGIGDVPMSFIRAPRITRVHGDAAELARVDGAIVAAREGNQIATTFHPELDDDTSIHELFLSL